MKQFSQRSITRKQSNLVWLVSPPTIVAVAFLMLVLSICLSPDAYEIAAKEHDYMREDAPLLLKFYGAICLSFLVGYFATVLASRFVPKLAIFDNPRVSAGKSSYLIPIFLGILLNLVSLAILIKNSPGVLGLIASGAGQKAKSAIDTTGGLSQAQPMLIGLVWWGMARHMAKFPTKRMPGATLSFIIVFSAFALSCTISLVKLARYELMPLFLGCFTIYILYAAKQGRANLAGLLLKSLGVTVLIVMVFAGMSALRGAKNSSEIVSTIIGYGPAAYNHLAVLLENHLTFPDSGHGLYAFAFTHSIPGLHKFSGSDDLVSAFKSEFDATRASGLNANYIWVTAPGYYYADLHKAVYPFMAVMGGLSAVFWLEALKGRSLGLVMHPFTMGTILMWFSSGQFTRPDLTTLLGLCLVLTVFSFVFDSKPANQQRRPQRRSSRQTVNAD